MLFEKLSFILWRKKIIAMKKIFYLLVITSLSFLWGTSCNSSDDYSQYPPVEINRLDEVVYDQFLSGDSPSPIFDSIMEPGVSAVTTMLNLGHPIDSAFEKYIKSDAVKLFTPEVANMFSDLTSLEYILGGIKANFETELPEVNMCDLYAIVSPYRQSIFIADSTMLIALNHYLGHNHKVYEGFDEYIKKTKDADYIPYDIVEAHIGAIMPYETNGNDDVLSKLLYAGVIAEAKMRLVPHAALNYALGYTPEELQWLEENQQQLWNALVAKEMLYSNAYMDIDRLLSPAPLTSILHPQAPGRAGRFLGYKIVQAYLDKNPKMELSQLLKPEFYKSQQILINSGYQGI